MSSATLAPSVRFDASRTARVVDAVLAPLGEQLVEQLGVGVGDVAEQLVGELAVRLREVGVGGGGRRVHERAAAALGPCGDGSSLDSTSAVVCQRGEVLARAAHGHAELLGDLLGGGLAAPAHRVEHRPPTGRQAREPSARAGGRASRRGPRGG